MRVRVVRAFRIGGKAQDKGGEVDLPDNLAREIISSGKAERVAAAPPVSGPLTTESASELVSGKTRKGEKHV